MKNILKKILLTIVSFSVLLLCGCASGPYVGKYISRSWPYTMYNGVGSKYDQHVCKSDDGSSVFFQYKIDNIAQNTYVIEGIMTHQLRVENYKDVYIHLWLLDGKCIVEDIRLFSKENNGENRISFRREFKTDNYFNSLSFGYKFIYTTAS